MCRAQSDYVKDNRAVSRTALQPTYYITLRRMSAFSQYLASRRGLVRVETDQLREETHARVLLRPLGQF
jgi:hypothetical protein